MFVSAACDNLDGSLSLSLQTNWLVKTHTYRITVLNTVGDVDLKLSLLEYICDSRDYMTTYVYMMMISTLWNYDLQRQAHTMQ